MIHHQGAGLRQSDLLLCRRKQQDLSLLTVNTRDRYKYHIIMPATSPVRATNEASHAWTNHHTQIIRSILAVYECCLCMVRQLPESDPSTTCEWPAVVSRSTNQCHACFNFSRLCSMSPILHSDSSSLLAFTCFTISIFVKYLNTLI